MDNKNTGATTLVDVLKGLGPGSKVVASALDLLAEQGKKSQKGNPYTRAVVYDVIHGRSFNSDVAEAFVAAAEAETTRRQELAARAAGVVAKATA